MTADYPPRVQAYIELIGELCVLADRATLLHYNLISSSDPRQVKLGKIMAGTTKHKLHSIAGGLRRIIEAHWEEKT